EFLKGEIKSARRTLDDAQRRRKYDLEIQAAAIGQMRELIQLFIQISGDLTEIEETEILHRGRLLNLPERALRKLVSQQLDKFGFTRVPPSAEQIARAKKILMLTRESSGSDSTAVANREEMLQRIEEEIGKVGLTSESQISIPTLKIDIPAEWAASAPPPPMREPRPADSPLASASSSGVRSSPGAESSDRIIRVTEDGAQRFYKLRNGQREKVLVFLALPESAIAALISAVMRSVCQEAGLELYLTKRDRWDKVLGQIKACDVMVADFSGPDERPEVPEPLVITQATIAKYQQDKPVLALTQAPPEARLPGWTFVHYHPDTMLDTEGESFPMRLKRAIRRVLK
ncbi:MAG: hypothetical protein AB7K09_16745, partial [Planctomycetota bacterium]